MRLQARPLRERARVESHGLARKIVVMSMEIQVNGEKHSLAQPTTVADLVVALGHAGKRVAVERNGEIVPRSHHASVELAPGDRIEIVVAVGGG